MFEPKHDSAELRQLCWGAIFQTSTGSFSLRLALDLDPIVSGVPPEGVSCNGWRLVNAPGGKDPAGTKNMVLLYHTSLSELHASQGGAGLLGCEEVRPAGGIKGYVCPGAGSSHNNS